MSIVLMAHLSNDGFGTPDERAILDVLEHEILAASKSADVVITDQQIGDGRYFLLLQGVDAEHVVKQAVANAGRRGVMSDFEIVIET
jgi:hypothetical protein